MPFQINSLFPQPAAPITAMHSSTAGIAEAVSVGGSFELSADGFARDTEMIGWKRYFSGMGGTGGVLGTVSKRLKDSLEAANELVECVGGWGTGRGIEAAELVVTNEGAEVVERVC